MKTWEEIKIDLIERFRNFETATGFYDVVFGVIVCYVAVFHVSFVIQAVAFGYGWRKLSLGLYGMWVNRFNQSRKNMEIAAKGSIVRAKAAARRKAKKAMATPNAAPAEVTVTVESNPAGEA